MNLAEFIGVLSFALTIVALLVRIAWSTGQLVQRFGDHVIISDRLHQDQESRLRNLEQRIRRIR